MMPFDHSERTFLLIKHLFKRLCNIMKVVSFFNNLLGVASWPGALPDVACKIQFLISYIENNCWIQIHPQCYQHSHYSTYLDLSSKCSYYREATQSEPHNLRFRTKFPICQSSFKGYLFSLSLPIPFFPILIQNDLESLDTAISSSVWAL